MTGAHVFSKRWGRDDGHGHCHSCHDFLRVGEKYVIFISKKSLKARALCMSCVRLIAEAGGLLEQED